MSKPSDREPLPRDLVGAMWSDVPQRMAEDPAAGLPARGESQYVSPIGACGTPPDVVAGDLTCHEQSGGIP